MFWNSRSYFLFTTTLALCAPLAAHAATPAKTVAVAELKPTQGSSVQGRITFITLGASTQVEAIVSGLSPGNHGFHIHEIGNCDAPDASSAGSHFNPHGKSHGGPSSNERHAGDLGNLVANDQGIAKLSLENSHLMLSGDDSIVGRSVIIHAQADDLTTQPTGNSGARQACGIVKLAS